jgi:nucleotide-binding universal stress UspA family protein
LEIGKILIGVDGSENSLRAVDFGADLSLKYGAKLTLLLAIAPSESTLFSGKDTYLPEKEGIHQIRLRKAFEIAKKKGVEVEERVELDHPAKAICDASGEFDLVIIGSRGLSGVRGFLMGSVSNKVVHHTKVPVVVVP